MLQIGTSILKCDRRVFYRHSSDDNQIKSEHNCIDDGENNAKYMISTDAAISICEIKTHAPAIPNRTPVNFRRLIASFKNNTEKSITTIGFKATISAK